MANGTITLMCDRFRSEVFAKAGKKDPRRSEHGDR